MPFGPIREKRIREVAKARSWPADRNAVFLMVYRSSIKQGQSERAMSACTEVVSVLL